MAADLDDEGLALVPFPSVSPPSHLVDKKEKMHSGLGWSLCAFNISGHVDFSVSLCYTVGSIDETQEVSP